MTEPSASALEIARAIQLPEKIVHIMGHDPLVVCLPGEELFTVIARAIDEARLAEREACARIADQSEESAEKYYRRHYHSCDQGRSDASAEIAKAIRNRT